MVRAEIYRIVGQSETDIRAYGAFLVLGTRPVRVFGIVVDGGGVYRVAFVRVPRHPTEDDLKELARAREVLDMREVEEVELTDVKEISEEDAEELVRGLRVLARVLLPRWASPA